MKQRSADSNFTGSYSTKLKGLSIDFDSVGECGMSGPIHGILSIDGISLKDRALGPVALSTDQDEIAFLTWSPEPDITIHIYNLENDSYSNTNWEFGDFIISRLDKSHLTLSDSEGKERIQLNRIPGLL